MTGKVLVLGANGFLGGAFRQAFPAWIPSTVDIADPAALRCELETHRPGVVINCAGKTGRPNIDWCETHRLETVRSNVTGPLTLLEQCQQQRVALVHLSSGCVYQGDNSGAGFREQDVPNFRESFYARTKLAAEQVLAEFPVLILRLRMPFDDSQHPRSLLVRLTKYPRVLDVENSITYLPDFVQATRQLIEQNALGLYHIVNPGTISPYEMMRRYQQTVDPSHQFERLPLDALPEVARTGRSNCVLATPNLAKAGIVLRPVQEAVTRALEAWPAAPPEHAGKREGEAPARPG